MDGTLTTNTSACPHPFLAQENYPRNGGFVWGRFCRDFDLGAGPVSCCLPCPWSSWRYSDDFDAHLDLAGWCGIPVIVIMVVFLVTYAVVPKIYTGRHYLTTVPIFGFLLLSTAYVMPLAKAPSQCYDAITPNDNFSDTMCTATSTVLFIGVWLVIIGCLFRTVSLHLFVVWEKKLGRKFRYWSLGCIFFLTILLVVLQQRVTGTTYQFGKVCYLKPIEGWVTFWLPLLGMGVVTFILQVWTLGYCLVNVCRGLREDRAIAARHVVDIEDGATCSNDNHTSSEYHDRASGSQRSSVRFWRGADTRTTRRKSLATEKLITSMQWRPMLASSGVLIYVVLITIIFMMLRVEDTDPAEKFDEWVSCIISTGDKNHCMPYLTDKGPDEILVVVTFFLLSVSGLLGVIVVMRYDMITGWVEVLKGRTRGNSSQQQPPLNNNASIEDQFPLQQVPINDYYATSFNTTPSLPAADLK